MTRPRIALVFFLTLALTPQSPAQEGWTSLFNGKDLFGWDTWLGKPLKANDPIGLNKDPRNVYTVVDVDGQPAIRISGEIFGAITAPNSRLWRTDSSGKMLRPCGT